MPRPRRALASLRLAVVVACSPLVAASALQQGLGSASYETISPSVVQNVFTHQEPDGSWKLDLLVLWRGAPGWFLAGGANGTTGSGGNGRPSYIHNRQADVDFDILFDAGAGIARLVGATIRLDEVNVVLVDGMPHQMKIVGTRLVDRHIARPPTGIQNVFRSSPELDTYLRCNVTDGNRALEEFRGPCTWGPAK